MPNMAKFAQRRIKATYGSFRSRTPLRTPSGPQFTESALESELLDQLHFVPGVTHLVTQAIIEYQHGAETRTYATDIEATLEPSLGRRTIPPGSTPLRLRSNKPLSGETVGSSTI